MHRFSHMPLLCGKKNKRLHLMTLICSRLSYRNLVSTNSSICPSCQAKLAVFNATITTNGSEIVWWVVRLISRLSFSYNCFPFRSQQIDEFRKHFESILASIRSLKENFANTSTMRSSEIEQTIKICSSTYADVQKSIKTLLDNGEFDYLICFTSV